MMPEIRCADHREGVILLSWSADGWWRTVREAYGDNSRTIRLMAILLTCAAIVAALIILGVIAALAWHFI
ncbi:hypothetical protein ACFW9X_39270 [Streptomyces sp. NPDC059466]|uniref:hypothetical protein n=1 Tax=Streptomyces sp. NPDC059466 TaxID=3346843 RepID=UPI0036C140A0